jgi:hypothetical protein
MDDRQRIELRMERHRLRNEIQAVEDAIIQDDLTAIDFSRLMERREALLLHLAELEATLGIPSTTIGWRE